MLYFTAELFYFTNEKDDFGNLLPPVGPIIDADLSVVDFNADGTFKINTDNLEMIGVHQLRIKASLVDHPY